MPSDDSEDIDGPRRCPRCASTVEPIAVPAGIGDDDEPGWLLRCPCCPDEPHVFERVTESDFEDDDDSDDAGFDARRGP